MVGLATHQALGTHFGGFPIEPTGTDSSESLPDFPFLESCEMGNGPLHPLTCLPENP